MRENEEKPLYEHIEELLTRLRRILIASILFIIFLFISPSNLSPEYSYTPLIFGLMRKLQEYLLDFRGNSVVHPLAKLLNVSGTEVVLIAYGWFDTVIGGIYLASLLAILVIGPYAILEVYRFIEPGLYPHEKGVVRKYLAVIYLLFVLGVLYSLVVLLPIMFAVMVWLTRAGGAKPIFSIENFFYTILLGSVSTGIFFMFPLAILTLVKINLVSVESLQRNWKIVILATFVVTAAITPDPTPLSMLALSLPFTGLYTLTLIAARRMRKDM